MLLVKEPPEALEFPLFFRLGMHVPSYHCHPYRSNLVVLVGRPCYI